MPAAGSPISISACILPVPRSKIVLMLRFKIQSFLLSTIDKLFQRKIMLRPRMKWKMLKYLSAG